MRLPPSRLAPSHGRHKNEATGESFDLAHPGGIPEFLGKLVADTQKNKITEQAFYIARDNGEKMAATFCETSFWNVFFMMSGCCSFVSRMDSCNGRPSRPPLALISWMASFCPRMHC